MRYVAIIFIAGGLVLLYAYLPFFLMGGCHRHGPSRCAFEVTTHKPPPISTQKALIEKYGFNADPDALKEKRYPVDRLQCVIPEYLHCD